MAEVAEQETDLDDYTVVRFHEARAAGLTKLEAARFAKGSTPLRTLRKLRRDGCHPAIIAQIVC